MSEEPLKDKSTAVLEILDMVINQTVEVFENELKRNSVDFEINYKAVMGVKDEIRKNIEIKDKVIFDGDNVKSAVEGFFNEFFEEQERDGHLKMSDVLRLKKKWFPDVIE